VLQPGGFLGWVGTWKSKPIPEVGFIFHRSAWGFGFATEALNAFVQLYWRVKPQFDALEAYCDTENEASVKVLRKSGFVFVESIVGDYVLPWMEPSLRSSHRFRATRPLIETTTS
jgi:RimJ/RimL family protein N-acetyltransferase